LEHFLRKALPSEAEIIWNILQQAIERRRKDGSRQWQDGYPNLEVVKMDISSGKGYVLEREGKIAAYAALVFNDEPAYDEIEGNWLTNGDFLVIHRVAVSDDFLGKGIAVSLFKLLEDFAKEHQVFSIKVDTNFDNLAMLHFRKIKLSVLWRSIFPWWRQKSLRKSAFIIFFSFWVNYY
jgi:GNAT superfamily N-acetyltransferase